MRLGHQVGSRQATIKLTFLWLSSTAPSDSSTSLNVATSTRFFAISLFFFWTSCPTQSDTRLFEICVFYSWTDTRFFSTEPAAPHKLIGCLLKCEVTLQLSPSWWHLGLPPFGKDLCPRKYLGIFFSQKIQKYCSDFWKITVVWFWHLYQLFWFCGKSLIHCFVSISSQLKTHQFLIWLSRRKRKSGFVCIFGNIYLAIFWKSTILFCEDR